MNFQTLKVEDIRTFGSFSECLIIGHVSLSFNEKKLRSLVQARIQESNYFGLVPCVFDIYKQKVLICTVVEYAMFFFIAITQKNQ